jgi:hypothetical protein
MTESRQSPGRRSRPSPAGDGRSSTPAGRSSEHRAESPTSDDQHLPGKHEQCCLQNVRTKTKIPNFEPQTRRSPGFLRPPGRSIFRAGCDDVASVSSRRQAHQPIRQRRSGTSRAEFRGPRHDPKKQHLRNRIRYAVILTNTAGYDSVSRRRPQLRSVDAATLSDRRIAQN